MTFDQKVAMALGDFAPLANLGVPTLTSADGPNGIRADGTTAFPSGADAGVDVRPQPGARLR